MGDREHKILLYADDVVLFLTQPLTSLSPLMEELESFSWASGFKVNIHKTQAHSSTLPKTEQQVLTAQFPFAWPSDGVPYLGMQIFPTLDKIAQVNYSTLLTEVRGELSNWRRHTMSWLGRLAAIKMTILPRILYVMQTLPLRLPPKMLAQLQRLIENFIWGGKRARMARHLMYLKQEDGGLGVPHLERYFQAAQLRYMLEWYKLESEKNWCFINRSIAGRHIWKVPWLPRWH